MVYAAADSAPPPPRRLRARRPARACAGARLHDHATAVAFGAYDPRAAGADDGTGTIALACHPSVSAPVVALGTGLYGSSRPARWAAAPTASTTSSTPTAPAPCIWGDGTSGTVAVTLTGGTVSGGERRFSRTVYGRIPALQNVQAGVYDDIVVVTVTF